MPVIVVAQDEWSLKPEVAQDRFYGIYTTQTTRICVDREAIARRNGIIKNFYACSPVVKCDLFKAFCCNMYCSHLWSDFKNDTLRRLIVGYNHSFRIIMKHSFRIIMKYSRHCSASGMFVFNDVPSFTELWRKSIYGFKQRVDNSLNKAGNTVANTSLLSSKLRKHWRTVQYILPVA